MSHLVLGLIGMAGIGLAIGAIFYQATKPRPGVNRFRSPSGYADAWGASESNGGDGHGGGHGGDGGH